jgi:PIN domain nuclease of toxin-antitoxin system
MLEDTANELFFSPANIWEIELKRDRLNLDPKAFYHSLVLNGYQELAITARHVLGLHQLPALHGDPFDRILLAQALTDNLYLLTADKTVMQYGLHFDILCIEVP